MFQSICQLSKSAVVYYLVIGVLFSSFEIWWMKVEVVYMELKQKNNFINYVVLYTGFVTFFRKNFQDSDWVFKYSEIHITP